MFFLILLFVLCWRSYRLGHQFVVWYYPWRRGPGAIGPFWYWVLSGRVWIFGWRRLESMGGFHLKKIPGSLKLAYRLSAPHRKQQGSYLSATRGANGTAFTLLGETPNPLHAR